MGSFRPYVQLVIRQYSVNFYLFLILKFATTLKQHAGDTLAWEMFTDTDGSDAVSNHEIKSTLSWHQKVLFIDKPKVYVWLWTVLCQFLMV